MLPKIHKGVIPPPGRPIISGNGSPTEKISQLVDHFLNHPCTMIKSYVKDTTHFLQLMSKLDNIPQNSYIVSLDVTSLYTNIPNKIGIYAAKKTLASYRPFIGLKPSNQSLIKLLEFVLTKNNFQFDGQHYLQILGTCMGTRVAPSFAINFMGWFEETFAYTYHTQPLIWLRYIDDIILIWTKSRPELDEFIQHLNTRLPSIKFTAEVSQEEVSFLDTRVEIIDGKIVTDLYSKPTDSHNYLLYNSAHPRSCRDSIPYSQLLRIRRICSNITDYDRHACEYAGYFLDRGYPLKIVEEAVIKARRLDRDKLLNPPRRDKKSPDDNIILTTTYHPKDDILKGIVSKNWDFLGKSPNTQKLHKKHLMVGYKRPKNLRDILVRADVTIKNDNATPTNTWLQHRSPPHKTVNPLVQTSITDYIRKGSGNIGDHDITSTSSVGDLSQKPMRLKTPSLSNIRTKMRNRNTCTNIKCRYCPLLDTSGHFTCKVTGQVHPCMINITCRSSNLIYCITCNTCGKQYVGQTKRKILQRFQGHFYNIKVANQNDAVGMHFSQPSHRGIRDITIRVLEFVSLPPQSTRSLAVRLRVEKKWIHTLRCPAPQGLNIFD